jgi:hypothetical protein
MRPGRRLRVCTAGLRPREAAPASVLSGVHQIVLRRLSRHKHDDDDVRHRDERGKRERTTRGHAES